MSDLLIDQMEVGPMANYIYFIGDSVTKEIVVVDPAWDVNFLKEEAAKKGYTLKAALVTHVHPDHNNGLGDILDWTDVPIYVNKQEAPFYKGFDSSIKPVDTGDKLQVGNFTIEFLHTPGHTPGSQCFLVNGNLIAGDTLFIDGCGRCDLPGGDAEVMYDTLYNRLLKLPANTMIFPGHNYHHLNCDHLENQKKTNPYLKCQNIHQFLSERMGL